MHSHVHCLIQSSNYSLMPAHTFMHSFNHRRVGTSQTTWCILGTTQTTWNNSTPPEDLVKYLAHYFECLRSHGTVRLQTTCDISNNLVHNLGYLRPLSTSLLEITPGLLVPFRALGISLRVSQGTWYNSDTLVHLTPFWYST